MKKINVQIKRTKGIGILKMVVSSLCLLCCFSEVKGQELVFGDIRREKTMDYLSDMSFVLSGKKMYEVGYANATYPVNDESYWERGVWCHPIKLMDGMSFEIIEGTKTWKLEEPDAFSYHFFEADFTFKHNQLEICRNDFVVEDESALFSTLKIRNKQSSERQLKVRLSADIHITPSTRTAGLKDSPDRIERVDNVISASDSLGALVIGSDRTSVHSLITDSIAVMEYTVSLPANGLVELPFLFVGDNQAKGDLTGVKSLFDRLKTNKETLYKEKQEYYEEKVLHNVRFACSNPDVTDAFYCAKANVLLNTKDCRPYYHYPFVGAGIPVYPRLFGTDFSFSTPGLLAGGNHEIVRQTLRNLVEYASEHWRGPHEIAADGILLGWDHIQVSPQLVTACWNYFIWTGDDRFVKGIYPFCSKLMDDVLSTSDKDGDLFLEGHGLMEESDFKGDWEELSSTAYLYPALLNLADMAQISGDRKAARLYQKKAGMLKKTFNSVWWNPENEIWACALDSEGNQKMYNFWSVVFPLKTGIADVKPGRIALANIGKNWVNSSWGMVGRYWPEKDMSDEGVGLVHNNICSTAAFAWGDAALGWKLIKLTTKGVFRLDHSLQGLFPECQPHLCTNITQLWSYGPFMESIVSGLMGVRPINKGKIEISPSFPEDLENASLKDLSIGKESLSIQWQKEKEGRINLELTYTGNRRDITLHLPKGKKVSVVWAGKH